MKLPALWIVSALAAGILLADPQPAQAAVPPKVWLGLAVAALLAGLGLLLRRRHRAAWALGLAAWVCLGALAAQLEELAQPANLITRLVADGRFDSSEAQRWRGRLREDPVRLPWGYRYDVDLEEVELTGQSVSVAGGLRVTYYQSESLRGERSPEARPVGARAGNRVEVLARAHAPRNFGNPGAFDVRGHLIRQNIHLTATLRDNDLLRKVAEPRPALPHRLARIRSRLLDRLDAMFATAPERAAVLRAMLLGDRSFIDHEQAEAFQKTAAFHVLVVAGLHVGALASFVLWAGRRLRLSLFLSILLTLAVLAAYVAVVEDRPPILRAALMGAIFLCARPLYRRVELLNILALAALVLLVARPSALADPSFQLSFVAVGTIGALAVPWIARTSEPYRRALAHLRDVTRDAGRPPRAAQFRLDARAAAGWLDSRLPPRLARVAPHMVTLPCRGALRLWEVFLLSATIQLGMLPLLAHYFHRVSLAGPLANIPAVLLTGLIVPLGFLALSANFAWPALGGAMGKVVGALVAALTASVGWFSRWNWAAYRIPGPPALLLAAFFALFILLGVATRRARKRSQLLLALALAVATLAVATYPFAPDLKRGKLEVTILDVGQGDSIFAAFPDGRTMLIDGGGTPGAFRAGGLRLGPDIGEQVVSTYLWSRGLKRLDVVALTHAHQDHLGGLGAVLDNFRVGELWVGRDVSTPVFDALLERARVQGAGLTHRNSGETFAWDGVSGRVLWPESADPAEAAKNNDSLVLRLEHGGVSLLLSGDIERQVESTLAARGELRKADFLKVAHHGSKTSTSAELLAGVTPQTAAISVGGTNPFGHPHPDVLERLGEAGARVLRTDRDGAITALSDGRVLRVSTFAQANAR